MPKESTNEREHDSEQQDERAVARDDPEATTEDQAANMDYEGDTPH